MRVVLINWAYPWDGATKGGGVNGYGQALAIELVSLGHDVSWLCSGQTYVPDEPVHLRRHPDWLDVRVFEVVNSPVMSPSQAQFKDPVSEIRSPDLERVVGEFVRLSRPEIAHLHNIEGFSIGCVDAFRAACPVVFSLHNYHTICPQVYLLHHDREVCHDSEGGRRCATCTTVVEPSIERERRLSSFRPRPRTRPVFQSLVTEFGRRPATTPIAPGRPVTSSEDVESPFPMVSDERGTTASIMAELDPPSRAGPGHPDWAPIDNRIVPEARCLETPYGERRAAMVDMLNRCDLVLAVSRFVHDKFVSLGVREDVIETDTIGTRMNRIARWHEDVVFAPPTFASSPDRPIRLLFLGYNNWAKGLPMLADALELLTPEVTRRLDLAIYAYEGAAIEWRFRRLEPRLARLEYGGGYQPTDVPWICGGRDLGIVPSVWWDNGPQTVLEFQACGLPVLGASIGGIPDFVREDVDGALFGANDRYDLARHLAGLVRAPERLDRWRSNVRPPKDITDHAAELATRYVSISARDRVGCDP